MDSPELAGVGSSIVQSLREFASKQAPRAINALIIVVIGLAAAKLARRSLGAFLRRTRINNDPLLKEFFLRSLSFAIILGSLLLAFEVFGWEVRTLIAGLGITGLLLGFGLRDTLSNLAAGMLLLIYRPFRAGETIEVEGSQGIVEELTIVNMQMLTNDGVRVIMPNSKVWGAKIVNYSQTQRRRMELTLKVREEDAEEALNVAKEALTVSKRVLETPSPFIRISAIADGAATLTIWAWTEPTQFAEAGGESYLQLLKAFRSAELQIL